MKSISVFISILLMGPIVWGSNIDKKLEAQIRAIDTADSIEEQLDEIPLEESEKQYFLEHFKELEIQKLPSSKLLKRKLDIQSSGPRPVHTLEYVNLSMNKLKLNGYELKGLHKMGPKKRTGYIKRVLRKTSQKKSAMNLLFPKAYAGDGWLDRDAMTISGLSYMFTSEGFVTKLNDINEKDRKRPHRVRLQCTKDGGSQLTVRTVSTGANRSKVDHTIILTPQDHRYRSSGSSVGAEAMAAATNPLRAKKPVYRQDVQHTMQMFSRNEKGYKRIYQLQRTGEFNYQTETNSFNKPEYCGYKPKTECKTGQKRPGKVTQASFDSFDPTAFYMPMQACCSEEDKDDRDECMNDINKDEEFGLDSPIVKRSSDRGSDGYQ